MQNAYNYVEDFGGLVAYDKYPYRGYEWECKCKDKGCKDYEKYSIKNYTMIDKNNCH